MSVQTSGGATGTVEHYTMPDAGEGLTEAEIVTWRVAVGDTVDVNDVVVEVETAKSLVELPCPFAGEVVELLAAEGETVAVGSPILAVRTGGSADGGGGTGGDHPVDDDAGAAEVTGAAPGADAPAAAPGGEPVGPSAETAAHPSTQAAAGAGRQAVLVGYGPAAGATRRRARRAAATPAAETGGAGSPASAPRAPSTSAPAPAPEPDATPVEGAAGAGPSGGPVLAKPPVRKLAKDLGVDLRAVTASGPGGIVTREDVVAAADGTPSTAAPGPDRTAHAAPTDDGVLRTPVKGVRKRTAEAMVASAFTAPHVTEWVQVDVTASVELLARLKADRATRDLRLSPFTLVARAMVLAARRHPEVNASWDEAAQEIVQHPHVGLGFAAATERGLVVPVVPQADRLDLAGLAQAIGELVDTARAGTIQPSQMSGCTLTVTNVGVFGVDGGTPILPPGTGLILACGQVRRMPWVVGTGADERVVPRDVMTLAASFDHRFVDGELGSRYLAAVARLMEDPAHALVWG